MKKKLGEILIESGEVRAEDVTAALDAQSSGDPSRLGDILIAENKVTPVALAKALCVQSGLPFVQLDQVSPEVAALVPMALQREHCLVPFKEDGPRRAIHVAVADPTTRDVLADLEFQVGRSLKISIAARDEIEAVHAALSSEELITGVIVEDEAPSAPAVPMASKSPQALGRVALKRVAVAANGVMTDVPSPMPPSPSAEPLATSGLALGAFVPWEPLSDAAPGKSGKVPAFAADVPPLELPRAGRMPRASDPKPAAPAPGSYLPTVEMPLVEALAVLAPSAAPVGATELVPAYKPVVKTEIMTAHQPQPQPQPLPARASRPASKPAMSPPVLRPASSAPDASKPKSKSVAAVAKAPAASAPKAPLPADDWAVRPAASALPRPSKPHTPAPDPFAALPKEEEVIGPRDYVPPAATPNPPKSLSGKLSAVSRSTVKTDPQHGAEAPVLDAMLEAPLVDAVASPSPGSGTPYLDALMASASSVEPAPVVEAAVAAAAVSAARPTKSSPRPSREVKAKAVEVAAPVVKEPEPPPAPVVPPAASVDDFFAQVQPPPPEPMPESVDISMTFAAPDPDIFTRPTVETPLIAVPALLSPPLAPAPLRADDLFPPAAADAEPSTAETPIEVVLGMPDPEAPVPDFLFPISAPPSGEMLAATDVAPEPPSTNVDAIALSVAGERVESGPAAVVADPLLESGAWPEEDAPVERDRNTAKIAARPSAKTPPAGSALASRTTLKRDSKPFNRQDPLEFVPPPATAPRPPPRDSLEFVPTASPPSGTPAVVRAERIATPPEGTPIISAPTPPAATPAEGTPVAVVSETLASSAVSAPAELTPPSEPPQLPTPEAVLTAAPTEPVPGLDTGAPTVVSAAPIDLAETPSLELPAWMSDPAAPIHASPDADPLSLALEVSGTRALSRVLKLLIKRGVLSEAELLEELDKK